MIRLLLGLFLYLALSGHSWYDHDCCDDRDCAPVIKVEPVPDRQGDYMTTSKGRVFVPWKYPKTRPSQDNAIHVCMGPPIMDEFSGDMSEPILICVYRPGTS